MITSRQPNEHSSVWSEAARIYGLLLTLLFLNGWQSVYRLNPGGMQWMGSVGLPQNMQDYSCFATQSDLLQACQLISQVGFQHMKGHQNMPVPTALTRAAWLFWLMHTSTPHTWGPPDRVCLMRGGCWK